VKESKGNVLVHCTTGKNIAPTIILAYMMMSSKTQNKHLPLAAALKYIKGKCISAQPIDQFLMQLVELEIELYDEPSMKIKGMKSGVGGGGSRAGVGRGGRGGRGGKGKRGNNNTIVNIKLNCYCIDDIVD
jgi:hypothetical protein